MGFFSRTQRTAQGEALESAVGPTSSVSGTLRSDGGVRVDGVFEGIIEVAGNVVVGPGGRVTGDITGRDITVGGVVHGNIDGTGQLQILATGQVLGDISVASVMIDEGGTFQGNSRLRGLDQPALPAPAAQAAPDSDPGEPIEQKARSVEDAPAVAATEDADAETSDRHDEPSPRSKRSAARQGQRRQRKGTAQSQREPSVSSNGAPDAPLPDQRPGDGAAGAPSAPETAVQEFADGLDIDLGRWDIEPTIPEEPESEADSPEPTAKARRSRSSRRSGKR